MSRTAKISIVLIIALAATAAGLYFGLKQRSDESGVNTNLLYSQTLPDVAGKAYKLADYRGKILVVNFWASWCVPCVQEIPEFSQMQTAYANKNVQFVGIGIDNASNIAEFEKKVPAAYPLLVAGASGSELARQLGNSLEALPFTLILDQNGAVKATKLGRLKEEELRAWIEARL